MFIDDFSQLGQVFIVLQFNILDIKESNQDFATLDGMSGHVILKTILFNHLHEIFIKSLDLLLSRIEGLRIRLFQVEC